MYDSIIANLPHPVMCYQDFWFPPSTLLFPPARVVEDYLRAYACRFVLHPHIHLNTRVVSTRWTGRDWRVAVLKTHLGEESSEEHPYDRLIVTNGHYRVPYYPPISGLDSWREAGQAIHAAWYRAARYVGSRVLVIGGGYSGADIAAEMSAVCTHLVHAAPGSDTKGNGNISIKGRVLRLSDWNEAHTAFFDDGSTETDIDYIFLATGYVLSFPFFADLQNSFPPAVPPLFEHLHNSGQHLFPLAHSLFPLTSDFLPHTAAFVGLPVKVAPLPLFEAQARAVVRVFADPSALDSDTEQHAIVSQLDALRSDPEIGNNPYALAHAWHRFKGREQFDYRDAMHALAGFKGEEWQVPEWTKIAYENMAKLRKTWKLLLETGEAEDWVRGVGEGGKHEWVEVMWKLLERAKTLDNVDVVPPHPASP